MLEPLIKEIRKHLGEQWQGLDESLLAHTHCDEEPVINKVSHYIIQSGGKRIRPLLLLLMAKSLAKTHSSTLKETPLLASVIELIHTSTLLHDDVVDESDMRRSVPTSRAKFGNATSVLVGDFLYSRSFQMMLQSKNFEVLDILANTTNAIAQGEVMQLRLKKKSHTITLAQYEQIIQLKTAVLFAASCQIGAVITKTDWVETDEIKACQDIAQTSYDIGLKLGMAYQLVDDTLDYFSSKLDKSKGDDWTEGKITFPLLLALESKEKNWFKKALALEPLQRKAQLQMAIEKMEGLGIEQQCLLKAERYTQQCLSLLKLLPLSLSQELFEKLIIALTKRRV